ncbi:MAG: hypothetical protein ABIH42_05070 [Planctomycetota bacterium]
MSNEFKTTVPYLVYKELVCALIVLFLLIIVSLAFDAPLEGKANPGITPNPAKAPWFFLPVQELLVYFDAWLAGVVLPLILVVALLTFPYLDFNPQGSNCYAVSKRKIAVISFFFLILVWFVLMWIALSFRCEQWQFQWRLPFQQLSPAVLDKVSPQVYSLLTVSTGIELLPEYAKSILYVSADKHGICLYFFSWLLVVLFLFGVPLFLVRLLKKEVGVTSRKNFTKAYILTCYIWVFVLVLLKIYFYWTTNLRYFLVTDWLNI